VAQLADEWEKRGTKVMGVSVDGVEDHKKWKRDIAAVGGAEPNFAIVADDGLEMAKAFDMLPAEAVLPDGRTPADSATVRVVWMLCRRQRVRISQRQRTGRPDRTSSFQWRCLMRMPLRSTVRLRLNFRICGWRNCPNNSSCFLDVWGPAVWKDGRAFFMRRRYRADLF